MTITMTRPPQPAAATSLRGRAEGTTSLSKLDPVLMFWQPKGGCQKSVGTATAAFLMTETGYAIAANPMGIEALPVKIGSPSVAMPGYEVHILDEAGHEVAPGQLGAIAIKLPLPPGTLPGLWNAEARFRKSYLEHFPG